MKLIVFVTTFLYTTTSAFPARETNELLDAAVKDLRENCKYPEALNNPEDYEKFFSCVYSKYAEKDVEEKSDQVKKIVDRLEMVIENNDDPELRKRRFKSVLYKNSDTFGFTKKQMAQYLRTSESLMDKFELENIVKVTNMNVDQIVDVSEKLVDELLDEGKDRFGNDKTWSKLGNLAKDFWGSYSKSEQGKKIEGFVDGIVDSGNDLLDENGEKSLVDISKEIVTSDEAKELADRVAEETVELVDKISEDFWSWW